MKRLLYFLALLITISYSQAQTSALTFTIIATDFLRPGAGVDNWNDGYVIQIPSTYGCFGPSGGAGVTCGIDRYDRFQWNQIENDDSSFNWTAFDVRIQIAIQNGQKFSFGVMPYAEAGSGSTVGGKLLTYPLTLHTQMQAEGTTDFAASDVWVPNWNSVNFMRRWKRMLNAVANHIATTSFNGVPYSKVIFFVDVRGYGNFGEWHNFPYNGQGGYPAAIIPTAVVLDTLIQSHIDAFPNYPLVILIGAFDPGNNNNIPAATTYFALTARNNWGPIGWRRDNWGDEVNYSGILENNPGSFNGLVFKTAIMSRWQTAPIVGEPLNGGPSGGSPSTVYGGLLPEMTRYGCLSFGNGNISTSTNATVIANVQAASKVSGYRLQIPTGTISTTINPGKTFQLMLNWQNIGVCPSYEKWKVQFELRSGTTTVIQTWTSTFQPKFFLPGNASVTDNLLVNGTVALGSYNLYMIIRDSSGYRTPMPLSQTGQGTDGAYLLKAVTVTAATVNTPPTSVPGPNQTITLPTNSVTFNGSGNVVPPAGSISAFAWSQVSGPNTAGISASTSATTNMTGLIAGIYVFNLKVTDNLGGVGNNTVQVTVNAAIPNTPPNVNAGADQILTLPTNNTTFVGTSSAVSPAVSVTVVWTKISGPATFTIVSPTALTTNITGLVQGVYQFQLKATDNLGSTKSDTIKVTVNQRPTVSAGANQTILLPTNSVSVAGTATAQPGGSISSVLWTKTSGPATFTITTNNALTTTVTGLIQGVYVFTLTATDNLGNTGSATVTITVNQKPVANAGSPQTITLPANSITLSGSGTAQPGGTISTYHWVKTSGPATFTITNANAASTTVTGMVAGVYVFTLTVTDNNGNTGTATVTITVNTNSTPPTVNAGSPQTILLPTNSVSLVGTATAQPGESITSVTWSKFSGPSTFTITSANTLSTTVTGLIQGVYVFQLSATDNVGNTATSSVTITVNQKPVSNAGSNQTITLPTSTVSLTGGGTAQPGGSIVSYLWTKTSGPTATITSNTSASTTVTGLVAGTYVFTLTVTDNNANTGVSSLTVLVNVANSPPVALVGPPQTITLPSGVTLVGSGNFFNPAGSIASYFWSTVSGPNGPSIISASTATTTVTGLVAGVYVFNLKVTDNLGGVGNATITVTVNNPPSGCQCIVHVRNRRDRLVGLNSLPIWGDVLELPDDTLPKCKIPTVTVQSQTITLPTDTIKFSASAVGNNGSSTFTYDWTQLSGNTAVILNSNLTPSITVAGLTQGKYVFNVKVTDGCGAWSNTAVNLTVNPLPSVKYIVGATGIYSHFLWWKWLTGVTINYSNNTSITLTNVRSYVWNQAQKIVTITFNNGSTIPYS